MKAVIAALNAQGLGPIIASDFWPERRALAEQMGADVIVDPVLADPHEHWRGFGVPTGLMELAAIAGKARRPVIFECVGMPGVCMASDLIEPMIANNKEIDLMFTMAYTQDEFAETPHRLCEGDLTPGATITGTIDLDGVPDAFYHLHYGPSHAKIMVAPGSGARLT